MRAMMPTIDSLEQGVMMSTLIAGASVWEQEFFDHVSGHIGTETAILDEYQRLAVDPTGSPAFRYLAGLILADERRHHQLFQDLAESIRKFAALQLDEEPIPSLQGLKTDRERIMETTERLLKVERADAKELKLLAKKLKEARVTTLWGLLIELMQDDTAKHIKILQFLRHRAADAVF
jgi:hypothetical protein